MWLQSGLIPLRRRWPLSARPRRPNVNKSEANALITLAESDPSHRHVQVYYRPLLVTLLPRKESVVRDTSSLLSVRTRVCLFETNTGGMRRSLSGGYVGVCASTLETRIALSKEGVGPRSTFRGVGTFRNRRSQGNKSNVKWRRLRGALRAFVNPTTYSVALDQRRSYTTLRGRPARGALD